MTKSNECTCPSGDGSLAHPCPAHPAPVEQAGGDERVIGWRERILAAHPNSDPGFWPDALLVEHMAAEIADLRAALAQPSPTIATAPTYQFHSREIGESDWAPCDFSWYLYCSKSPEMDTRVVEVTAQPSPAQARSTWPKLEKPAQVGAVRFSAGMSSRLVVEAAQRLYEFESTPEKEAERIERLQAFREQCFEPLGTEFSKVLSDNLPELLSTAQAEHAEAEAERPEAVGYLLAKGNGTLSILRAGSSDEPVMTVAQHDRIVDALRFERQQMDRAFTACINERDSLAKRWDEAVRYGARIEEQRDAALARVAELERVLRVVVNAADHGSWPTTVMHGIEKVREVLAGSAPPVKAQPEETPGEILAAKLIETWVTKHGKPAPWSTAVEITALATNMPNDERDRLLALDDDVDAQAQHSVPELDQLYSMLGAESQVDAAKKIAELIGCRMSRSALTEAQMRRIYENSTEIENERLGFAAFARLMRRAEAVHQIAAAPGKEVGHE
ncbi:TPA: hypothetical protein L4T77_004260 [Pseudomonas aeruginosa]|nr:hypothetical protein [Pseudomonas aeruginosa]